MVISTFPGFDGAGPAQARSVGVADDALFTLVELCLTFRVLDYFRVVGFHDGHAGIGCA